MRIKLGYDRTWQTLEAAEDGLLGVVRPDPGARPPDRGGWELAAAALAKPVGTPRLGEMVRPWETVAIVAADPDDPSGGPALIGPVLDELAEAGVSLGNVEVVLARGPAGRRPAAKTREIVGDPVYERVRCLDSDPGDWLRLGRTAAGTPVDLCPTVVASDRRICLGKVEHHRLFGYTGGAEAMVPGAAGLETITALASLALAPGAGIGRLSANPVRRDLEEAARLCPVDMVVNTVVGPGGRTLMAVAGHYLLAHRVCCHRLDERARVGVDRRGDVVVASAGGHPADRTLLGSLGALDRAQALAETGGVIVLVAGCADGVGDGALGRWMAEADHPARVVERLARDFEPGGDRAATLARILMDHPVYLVSRLDPALVESMHMRPFHSVQEALQEALTRQGPRATVWIAPQAGAVLPAVMGD
jgi:nickel-dependent lactate racemase